MRRRESLKSLISFGGSACLGGGLLSHGLALAAEPFPSRPLKLIVPYTPGGNADFLARLVGDSMTQTLGKSVIIDNRPGANAHIGMQALLREPADGYTLMINGVGSVTTNFLAMPNLGYDPFRDIQVLTVLVNSPFVFCVPADSPFKNFDDFLKAARAKPGSLSYGSIGVGSSWQLATELLSEMAGIQLNHVPYKGSPAAMTDLISGRLNVMLDTPQSTLPFIRGQKLRALGVTSATAAPQLPQVEPIAKWVPGYSYAVWIGIFARSGIPAEAKQKLQGAMSKALSDPVNANRLIDSGNVPQAPMTDSQIASMLRSEDERVRDLVIKRKIQFN